VQLWDTAGQERFKTITASYYKGAHGVIFVFDLSNRKSFENVQEWASDVISSQNSTAVRALVGNKADLNARDISETEIGELAGKLEASYIEVSAKRGTNIDKLYQNLSFQILSKN
jgi:small GTP-binding protein